MIYFQLLLIAAFLYILVRLLANPLSYRMQAWQKIFSVMFFLTAVFAVLFPDKLNDIANVFGIGRGADLMLYLLVLAFILVVCKMYVKEAHDRRRSVRLVRAIAITAAGQTDHNTIVRKKLRLG